MATYASLSAAQQAQAAWLFADVLIGTNPNKYEYELIGETVIGRSRIAGDAGAGLHALKPHTVAVNIAVMDSIVTAEVSRDVDLSLKELAQKICERMIQSQSIQSVEAQ